MSGRQTITFQEALEIIESLPADQQEDLIDLVRRRLVEQRRDALAESVKEARDEFQRGEVERGSVTDLLRQASE